MVECVCNGSSDAPVACVSPPQPFCVYAYVCAYDDGGDARDDVRDDVRVCGDV